MRSSRHRRPSLIRRSMRISTIEGVFAVQYGTLAAGTFLITFLLVLGATEWQIGLVAAFPLLANGNLVMRLAPELGKTSFFAVQAALSGVFGALGPFIGGVAAEALMAGVRILPGSALGGLKTLFLVSAVLRFSAWGLLRRVPEPGEKPRLKVAWVIRDAVRTFNLTQGFSPLYHAFTPTANKRVRRRNRRNRVSSKV